MYGYPYENAYLSDREDPSFNIASRIRSRRGAGIMSNPRSVPGFPRVTGIGLKSEKALNIAKRFNSVSIPAPYRVDILAAPIRGRDRAWKMEWGDRWTKDRTLTHDQNRKFVAYYRRRGTVAYYLKVFHKPHLANPYKRGYLEAAKLAATSVLSDIPLSRVGYRWVTIQKGSGSQNVLANMSVDGATVKASNGAILIGLGGIAAAWALGVRSGSTRPRMGSRAIENNKQRAAVGAGVGSMIFGSLGAAVGGGIAARSGTKGSAMGAGFAGGLVGAVPKHMILAGPSQETLAQAKQLYITSSGAPNAEQEWNQKSAMDKLFYVRQNHAALDTVTLGHLAAGKVVQSLVAAANTYYFVSE